MVPLEVFVLVIVLLADIVELPLLAVAVALLTDVVYWSFQHAIYAGEKTAKKKKREVNSFFTLGMSLVSNFCYQQMAVNAARVSHMLDWARALKCGLSLVWSTSAVCAFADMTVLPPLWPIPLSL
jgi:uncharacterized membrane protein